MRQIYHLEGLACASCAQKIEGAACKVNSVKKAAVDFSSGRLIIETDQTNNARLIDDLQNIASAIDPRVIVSKAPPSAEKQQLLTKRNLAFAAGLICFFTALFFSPGLERNILFVLSYFLAGFEIIIQAVNNIKQGQIFDENFLMAAATLGALAIKEFPEAASVMLFYRTGEFLQSLAVDHSRRSVSALIAIKPEVAHRRRDGAIADIPVEEVEIGDVLVVYPGERIPVDGNIIKGSSDLDTSALTGESLPRSVSGGEKVLAGCINLSGLLIVEAERRAAESAVSRILDLVENAAANKAPTEDFITSFARWYTPAVVGIAALIAVLPPLVFGAAFKSWFYRALVFLVISCPCALVVSIPLSFFAGIGSASRRGILVKGGNYLQALYEADTVIFDKTGTLTSGQFAVKSVDPSPPYSKESVLQAAAYAESFSSHPIARSIVDAYGEPIRQNEIDSVEELAGFGVKALWRGKEILVGSRRMLEQKGIKPKAPQHSSAVYTAIDGVYAGMIVLSDSPKAGSAQAVQALQNMGKEVVMLTGDSALAANQVSNELGISTVYSELLPHQKVEKVEQIMAEKNSKGKVVFVGDGINDAPALARAHAGIAMGALGSDAAVETADIVLMTDQPLSVVDAVHIAARTNRIVRQNIALALGVKLIVLTLGVFGAAPLWAAVFADVGVTVLTVLNSVRIVIPAKDAAGNRRPA